MTSLKLISTKQHVTSRKCELLFNCLHMVQLRGKDEYTRCQVEKFIDSVCDFEEKNLDFVMLLWKNSKTYLTLATS